MKRRTLLKSLSAAASVSAFPFLSSHLHAAQSNYKGPLWITLEARGGWDPTSFCDPKGEDDLDLPATQRINNYLSKHIDEPRNAKGNSVGSPIRYAPPPIGLKESLLSSLYSNKEFFDSYYDKLLIVNGIDTKTLSHRDGVQHSWSGAFGGTKYPSMGAMIAGLQARNNSIPFLVNGGYTTGAGLTVPVRLSFAGQNTLVELAFPNRSTARGSRYLPQDILDTILTHNQVRSQQLETQASLLRVKSALTKYRQTKIGATNLDQMYNILSNSVDLTAKDSRLNKRKKAKGIYQQARLALSAYQAGVSAAAHILLDGFDTHNNHEAVHYPLLMDLLLGIDSIMRQAQAMGLADKIVLIVASDFGRTNHYNNKSDGKDHWPLSSMLFMGNSKQIIRGNRVVGGTTVKGTSKPFMRMNLASTSNLMPVDISTKNSIRMTPSHIHRAIRRLAGINLTSEAQHDFSLDAEDLDLF